MDFKYQPFTEQIVTQRTEESAPTEDLGEAAARALHMAASAYRAQLKDGIRRRVGIEVVIAPAPPQQGLLFTSDEQENA